MKLEYQLILADYQEANQAHIKSLRFFYNFLSWGCSISFILMGLLSTIGSPNTWEGYFFLALGICYIPLLKVIQRYKVAHIWKNHPTIRDPINLEVTEEGLSFKTPNIQSVVNWQVYTKFIETKKIFMVYQSNQIFIMISKRAFSSNEQLDEFRNLLSTKVIRSR